MGSNWMRSTTWLDNMLESVAGLEPGLVAQIRQDPWLCVLLPQPLNERVFALLLLPNTSHTRPNHTDAHTLAHHITSHHITHTYIHTQILDDDNDDERDYAASFRRAPTLLYPRALTRRVEIVQTMHLQKTKLLKWCINYNNNKFCTNVLIFVCADVFLSTVLPHTNRIEKHENVFSVHTLAHITKWQHRNDI